MIGNIAFCYVLVGTIFQLHDVQTYFSHCVRALLDGESADHWIG